MKMDAKNKRFYIEVGIFTLFIFLISTCVFLNGDDFMYATFAKEGIVESVASYYVTGNGRFIINVLDSLLLSCDRYLFAFINPLIVLSFVFLMAKNIVWILEKRSNWEKEKQYVRYGMVLFACLDILCLRETVFWITGMMNYLLPATIFLAATWIFQMMRVAVKPSWTKVLGYWGICFLAGFSVEQFALMFVGMMTLLMLTDIISKKKPKPYLWIGYLVALAGLTFLVFAPGNFVRVNTHNALMPPFIDNIWTLVYQDTMSPVPFPYLLMLCMCSAIFTMRYGFSKPMQVSAVLLPVLMLAIRCIPVIEKAVLISVLLVYVIWQVFYFFVYRNYAEKPEIISLIVVGLGSQIMLLISAVWGFRCMFSLYMVYMMLIIFCLPQLNDQERLCVLGSGIVGSLNPLVLATCWICGILLKEKRIMNSLWKAAIPCATVFSLIMLLAGYAGNAQIHTENIQASKNASGQSILEIQALRKDMYGWYSVPLSEFHEGYYRRYYELPDNLEIHYIENIEEN